MQARWTRLLPLCAGLLLVGACERFCPDDLGEVVPRLLVDPERVDLSPVGVAEDRDIIITISNPSSTELRLDGVFLAEGGDPNFRLIEAPQEVLASQSAQVRVRVRPRVIGQIATTLVIDAEEAALPVNYAEVPITVDALDLGLPDIEVDPVVVDFARIGQNDVARASVTVRNVGVRDLIFDETVFAPDVEGDNTIRLINPVTPDWALAPTDELTLELVFAPTDTVLHEGLLQIHSNDPDEELVEVPVQGRGSECPEAVIEVVDDITAVEPLDTIRITGENSFAVSDGTDIAADGYEWRLVQRPVGSTAVLDPISDERVQLTLDLAGDYEVGLTVIDTDGIRSCNDAVARIHVEPSEDLHIQLVWDHQTADLDLHLLNEGGAVFTHEGDVYFSNREPLDWFPSNPEWVPSLDADDNRGYGPENINIEHPEPGSRWRVLAHYWNKQTDGDAFTVATLRIYAYGQLVADIPQSFESDQTLWRAVEIVWSEVDGEMPQINQIGQMEPFPRPF